MVIIRMNRSLHAPPVDTAIADIPASTRMSRRRRVGFGLLVLCIGLGLALAATEAALWLIAPVPYNEWMVWQADGYMRGRPAPNQVVHNRLGQEVRINKYGFRGPDYAFTRLPGTLRVVVHGGSAGFCFDVKEARNAWPTKLEEKLRARLGMPVEVINLALPGFDVFNSKQTFQCWGRAFQPDVVLIYHSWNDMKFFRALETVPYRSTAQVPNKPLWQRIGRATQLGRRTRNFYWKITNRQLENEFQRGEADPAFEAPVAPQALEYEQLQFTDFVALVRHSDALPVLVTQATTLVPERLDDPEYRQALTWAPRMVGMSLERAAETWQLVNERIAAVARETNTLLIDGYNGVPHDLKYVLDTVHLSDEGCELLAELLAEKLVADAGFQAVVEKVRMEASAAKAP